MTTQYSFTSIKPNKLMLITELGKNGSVKAFELLH